MELGQGSLCQYLSNTEREVQMNDICNEQITSSAASTLQYIDYLPIYPSKKNQYSGVQLKLCNDWDAWTYTEKKSYVKMDEVYEIPVERLTAAGANGRQYELQSKSWDRVQNFLRKMNVRANHDGQVASDSVSSPVLEGRASQALGAGVAFDAGEYSWDKYSLHKPPEVEIGSTHSGTIYGITNL